MGTDHGNIPKTEITVRFEVDRHIEKIIFVLNERVQNFEHEWLRKSRSDAARWALPVRNVLQHQSESCIFSRFHLFQINYESGVVHILFGFLSRKHSGIDRLESPVRHQQVQDRYRRGSLAFRKWLAEQPSLHKLYAVLADKWLRAESLSFQSRMRMAPSSVSFSVWALLFLKRGIAED